MKRKTLFDALYHKLEEIEELNTSYGYIICTPELPVYVLEGSIHIARDHQQACKKYKDHLEGVLREMQLNRFQDNDLPF